MNRRNFIKYSVTGVTAVGVLGFTAANVMLVPYSKDISLAGAIALLSDIEAKLTQAPSTNMQSNGRWQPAQIFNHAAQSVEYSFSNGGYPEHKSEFFKSSVGAAAFAVFTSNKAMTHNLAEAIPGAPKLPRSITNDNLTTIEAIQRLKRSLTNFQNFSGQLNPHFAYGSLGKEEYELAHVMHLHDHLRELFLITRA